MLTVVNADPRSTDTLVPQLRVQRHEDHWCLDSVLANIVPGIVWRGYDGYLRPFLGHVTAALAAKVWAHRQKTD